MTRSNLLLYFLKLGAIGFGGPLALISQMQKDLILKHQLLTEEEFDQAMALIKTLPGPVAIQMVAFIAYRKVGALTAVAASILFVLPASLLMLFFGIFYKEIRSVSISASLLNGMQAGALALIAEALIPLSKGYYQKIQFWLFFVIAIMLLFVLQLSEPIVILVLGLFSIIISTKKRSTLYSVVIVDLLFICLKAGGLAFGTGFAIVPMLQKDFVERLGWMTQQEFLDALALGQLTPGPISVTVTFVGYHVAGIWGAIVATFGIFFPGVFNMTTWFPRLYDAFRAQKWIKDFILGAISAIAAGIVISIMQSARSLDYKLIALGVLAFVLNRKFKVKSWILILLSGVAGIILSNL